MKKRILALSLALLMVVSILPVQGFANDESTGSDIVIVDQPAPQVCPDCGSDEHTVHPAAEACPDCGSTEHTVHPAADPAPQACETCGNEPCTCGTPAPQADLCDKCGKAPCECPTACETCGKTPCECPPAPVVCETCNQEPCVCPVCPTCNTKNCTETHTPAPQVCETCNQEPCVCPVCPTCNTKNCTETHTPAPQVCETCNQEPCTCPVCETCGNKNCTETHVTLVEQLLGAISLAHFRELFNAEANQAAVQALTKEEITSLIAKVEALYAVLEAPLEANAATRDELIAALKALPAMACPECGEFEGHAEGCTNIPMMSPQPPATLADKLLEVTTLEEFWQMFNSEENLSAVWDLTVEEIEALQAHVESLYQAITEPTEDDTFYYDDLMTTFPILLEELVEEPALMLPPGYIYFDLYYGNVTIKDGTYTGYVRGSNGTAQIVTDTHNNSNQYYIFQSNGESYPADGSIPDYPRVKYAGQSWGDYITNHPMDSGNNSAQSVDSVISAWGSVDHKANSAESGAAVTAGRQPTEHYIDIQTTTNGNTYNVVIDDLWSSFSLRVDPNCSKNEKWEAAMAVICAGFNYKVHSINNTLNLKLVGDNRFGRIQCATYDGVNGQYYVDTQHTNKMVVTTLSGYDDATLTCANITANADHMYTSAAIGGTDGTDHTVKLVFNQGTIYAGNAYGDFGSGIGGGGNGDGYVTINGGRVTAVNSATGAAIGGGCGTSGPGGYGNVTITNGNVYAYNYKPCGDLGASYSDAMPTAIGGGSSGIQIGGLGIVNISGGKVYAYSQVGNAIGGGGGGRGVISKTTNGVTTTSYYSTTGGIADVTISGGTVDAISGTGCAIGGGPGGGRGYTAANAAELHADALGLYADGKVSANGGTAKLTISGGTVRSGSIGGGSPLVLENGIDYRDKYGFTVGAAVVNISGGNIHGQVVMNGEIKANTDGFANNVHPTISGLVIGQKSSFTMTGGTIDNTPIGNEYHFVEKNGGAVYINSGSAKMSGGEIRDASSPLGGAIYLQGGDFELSGTGLIQDCSATEYGGAVYVKGGDVKVSGGTIQKCTAPNGGAAYVTGGNFTMSDGTIGSATVANTNTADNGAGVYVNGGQFTMSGGKMIGNKATENGGAAYVTGGNFTMSGGAIGGEGNGEANTAVNGAGVYVKGTATTGKVEMTGGSITANKATENGGAAYVEGGNITMKGGTIDKNTAINGAGVYVTGGTFDMISGSLTNNVASSYGGGAYVHGGNIIIGVQNCNGSGDNHSVTHTGLTHPKVLNNDASFGGGLAADGGEINIYCGKIISNTADNTGMGYNIFMYDSDSTDEEKPVLNHIGGTVGEDTDHGMVVIGGELTVPVQGAFIKIKYHGNDEAQELKIWVSEAPETYYLNLPYCPPEWEATQSGKGLTFVGWTYDTSTTKPPVQDSVNLSFIRDKEDYRALGDAVEIHKADWEKFEDGGYYIDFYAVWAPLQNTVSYEIHKDNYGNISDVTAQMTDTEANGNTKEYTFSHTQNATIKMTNPSIPGYKFVGWKITPSGSKISNWCVENDAKLKDKSEAVVYAYPENGSASGTAKLTGNFADDTELTGDVKVYDWKYENGEFILTTDRNFGDITMTAMFEELPATYTFNLIGPENATNFGTMTATGASEKYTTATVNKQYTVTIGKVNGDPGIATAAAEYGFKLKDGAWFTDELGNHVVPDTAATIEGGKLTPVKVNNLYEGGTFYAVIEYHLADLVISKTADGYFKDDQTFIFEVYQGSKLLTTVSLQSGESVTIKDLTIGTTYTVKEVGGWSWRFDEDVKTHEMKPVIKGAENPNVVAFTNTQQKHLWLTDDTFCLNKRKGN